MKNRRAFLKSASLGLSALTLGNQTLFAAPKSYKRILGSNERIQVGLVGLGRRYGGFIPAIAKESNNVQLLYLCDVMKKQRENAAKYVEKEIGYQPQLENDIRKILEDSNLDAIFNATPDHWHTPGSIMALNMGKHVYVEKPCSHNMEENNWLVAAQKKKGLVVQMGNQQRSSRHTQEIIKAIHDGAIGNPFKAVAFYSNSRGEVTNQSPAPIPEGLDWDLFQGPAIRRNYTHNTWDYNWHWYGWDYGTAEAGNNGTHEMDVARWALQVDYPIHAKVSGHKNHFTNDGWEMYDTIFAEFLFENQKIIEWDSKSRNGYPTYGADRGVIIYGSEGTVFVNRNKYILHDRSGKIIREVTSGGTEAGTALGGGGDMTTAHVENFFQSIRGLDQLNAPIDDASISMAMVHYTNVAYRIGEGFEIDRTGRMLSRKAMELWGREYEEGWKPSF
jgi:predicted dehydrogenase